MRARQASYRIEQDHDVAFVFNEPLGLFDDHIGDLNVAGRRLVERRAYDLAVNRPLHVGYFFRALVDQEDDQGDLGMVPGDGVCDVLQQHRLAGSWWRDDKGALSFADRGHQVEDAGRQILGLGLHPDLLLRIERRQVVEEDAVSREFRRLEVYSLDFDQREIAFTFLWRTDLARDGVAGAQVELSNLRRADVDVVGSRQVVVIGRAQEPESVREGFQNAFGEDEAGFFGLRLEDLEDQLLLAHSGGAGDIQLLGDLGQFRDGHVLKVANVHQLIYIFCHDCFDCLDGVRRRVVGRDQRREWVASKGDCGSA